MTGETFRSWALQERRCTDTVMLHFLLARMTPRQARDYMLALEESRDTRYPPLDRRPKGET